MKMFAEDKAKWLEALRSGEYDQCKFSLHDPARGGFCCLGVLEHCLMDGRVETIANVNGVNKYRASPTDNFNNLFGIVDAFSSPYKLVKKAGMTDLMSMNDSEDMTFSEIADWIEKNVEVHAAPRSAESQAIVDATLAGLE